MTTKPHIRARKAWWTPALAVLSWLPIALGAATAPRITSIDVARDDLVISAEAPEGVLRLVLEGAERGEFRSWRPRAVQRVANPGPVTFRLPLNLAASLRVEMFRVRADTNDPLPAAFYTGKTQFAGEAAPAGSAILFRGNDGSEWVVDNAVPGAPTSTPPPASSPQRNVAESDIWRLHGDRLYFFNHQRGLQIVDVSQPDKPTLLATFPLPASGEQMYLLGDRHVVLLARSHPCDEGWGMNAKSAAILIDVSGDQPREAARIPLEGRILESRLVGSALYVATDTWQIKSDRPEDAGAWINGTRLVGIDLADPAKPAAHESVWLPGSGNVVTATERFLMVGTQTYDSKQWWQSRLHLLDIEDPSGSIRPFAELTLDGRLQDKFKVDVNGNILTTITAGPSNADGTGPWRSTLATYRLADPAAAGPLSVVRLGSVEVGHGEQLYATRFDGQRAYLVTFRQIDPLWIIDLSQPEQPRVLGELEIPGWSTYMYPMGDRLLTVGFDNTVGLRAAVQLFDVSNPAKPALLSKVPLGKEWSWSEANSDEKALGVFPASGLVLVPFSSSAGDQQVLGVQVIDLGRDALVARGQIENPNVVPRRTSVAGDRVFAVSARDLVSVDIADRDHPSVRARLELSYPVERVVAAGSWLVEVSGSRLRSRAAGDAGDPRAELELKPIPVLGAALRDGRILVLQGRSAETIWQNDQWITNNPAAIRLTLIDAAKLPALEVLGTVEHPVEFWASGDYEALWPEANLVVWSPVSQSTPWYYFRGGPVPIDLAPTPALTDALPAVPQITAVVDAGVSRASIELGPGVSFAAPDIAILPGWRWWQPSAQPLFAFDVADPASPRFASKIPAPEGGFTQSRAAAAPGMIYFGYDTQETRITGTNTYVNVISQPVTVRREVLVTNIVEVPYETVVTNIVAKEFWVSAWELATPVLAPVAAGTLHAVGLDARGQAYGWGDNRAGQLGSFTSVNSEVPIAIPFPGFVTSVAAAKWFSLARLSSGAVWMAGTPVGPDGPPIPADDPSKALENPIQPVADLPSDIADIAAGYHHALARAADGSLYAWGLNDRGQLGLGDLADRRSPSRVAGLPNRIARIAGGGLHSLALAADGAVFAWGDNEHRQVDAAAGDHAALPHPVSGLPPVRDIAAGDFHSLALDTANRVWTWGAGGDGEVAAPAARPVEGLPPIRAIAAGRYHSVAVDSNGQVWTWGAHAAEPFRIQKLGPVNLVAARGGYAVANADNGRTLLWQYDAYPTPIVGSKSALTFVGNTHTNIGPGFLYRTETNVVTKTVVETQWVETTVTNSYPAYEYITHHHLSVVDFSGDPSNPVVRPPVALPGSFRGLSHEGALVYTLATRTDAPADANATSRTWLEAAAYDGTAAHWVAGLDVANLSKGDSASVEITPDGSVWLAQTTDSGKSHALSLLRVSDTAKFEKRATLALDAAVQSLDHVGDVATISFGSQVRLFRVADGPSIAPVGQAFDLGCLLQGLHRLSGGPETGYWAPLGDYGSAPLP